MLERDLVTLDERARRDANLDRSRGNDLRLQRALRDARLVGTFYARYLEIYRATMGIA